MKRPRGVLRGPRNKGALSRPVNSDREVTLEPVPDEVREPLLLSHIDVARNTEIHVRPIWSVEDMTLAVLVELADEVEVKLEVNFRPALKLPADDD